MKFIPISFEVERAMRNIKSIDTVMFTLMEFDWVNGNSSLFEIGFYQGEFQIDFLYLWAIKTRIIDLVEKYR